MRKLFVYFLWTLLTLTILGTAGAFYAIDKGWIGYMPPIEDLQNPISPVSYTHLTLPTIYSV